MKLKRFFSLVLMGGFLSQLPLVLAQTEPEVSIPKQTPPPQGVSAELPEPQPSQPEPPAQAPKAPLVLPEIPEPTLSPDTLTQGVPPGGSSFSVMTKRSPPPAETPKQAPATEPLVPPSGVISIRPAEPSGSPVPEALTQKPEPPGEKPPTLGTGPSAKPSESPAPEAKTQKPEPPGDLRVIEPPREEPPTLGTGPSAEPPARISSAMLEPKKEALVSSRTIWGIVGQSVDIPFRGNGWVYLGEEENRQGITYNSRRLENDGQHFIFRAETAGTYGLKFYKQDFIEDLIINDYVQVVISENPIRAGANRTQPVERTPDPGPQQSEAVPNPNPLIPRDPPLMDYLQQAQEAYSAGRFPQAISLLEQFREQYPAGTDEAWWLYGQSLEANSTSRDIRSALDYYRRLLQEYPQSPRGIEAQRRIAYLERYYFNIR